MIMARKPANLKKPDISAALDFAEGESQGNTKKVAQKANMEAKKGSGQVPAGDIRLNANVRRDLHLRIKIEAAKQGRSIGEIIEELIDKNIPKT